VFSARSHCLHVSTRTQWPGGWPANPSRPTGYLSDPPGRGTPPGGGGVPEGSGPRFSPSLSARAPDPRPRLSRRRRVRSFCPRRWRRPSPCGTRGSGRTPTPPPRSPTTPRPATSRSVRSPPQAGGGVGRLSVGMPGARPAPAPGLGGKHDRPQGTSEGADSGSRCRGVDDCLDAIRRLPSPGSV